MKNKNLWATDLHLDHAGTDMANKFCSHVNSLNPDNLFISGDIASRNTFKQYTTLLKEKINAKIYYILGNHDFYGSRMSFEEEEANLIAEGNLSGLIHLNGDIIKLDKSTSLIGHRGWACGTAGLGSKTNCSINDQFQIGAFKNIPKLTLFMKLRALGEESAEKITNSCNKAINDGAKHLFILTHVPLGEESAWFDGNKSEPSYLPWFCNEIAGKAIRRLAINNQDVSFTVLAGHTHHPGISRLEQNLVTYTAGAKYNNPTSCGWLLENGSIELLDGFQGEYTGAIPDYGIDAKEMHVPKEIKPRKMTLLKI